MAVHEEFAGDELERTLARYARVRLDPSPAASKRARAAIMDTAWRSHLERTGAPVVGPRRRGLFAGWSMRRLSGTLAAAVLAGLLVGSTTLAASRAGGPLYDARLGLEELALPSDPASRLEAELARAQTRLAEAVDASTRGDEGALEASLAAYGQAIEELGSATGPGAERALEAIRVHRAVLVEVLAHAPASAAAGLDRAIANSETLIVRLDETVSAGGGSGGGSGGAGGGGGGQPGGGQAGKPTPEPEATPKPTKEPKPEATPKPTREPKPEATPKPERTPKPRPTPAAPDQANPNRESPSP